MKKKYFYITICLLTINFSFSQSKEDIKLYIKLRYHTNPERIIKKYPNNPVVKLYKLRSFNDKYYKNKKNVRFRDIRSKYNSISLLELNLSDFSDSLKRIESDLKFLKQRQNEVINLKTIFEGRKDQEEERKHIKKQIKKREGNNYKRIKEDINDIYMDSIKFNNVIKNIQRRFEKINNESFFSEDRIHSIKELNEQNFLSSNSFGQYLYSFIKSKNNNDLINNVLNKFSSIPINAEFEKNEKEFLSRSQYFIQVIFSNFQRSKDGVELYYKKQEGENTIDNTIENVLKIFDSSDFDFSLNQFNDNETSEVVKILRSNDYNSPYIDLMNMRHNIHSLLFTEEKNYTYYINWIYENVFKFDHNYEWDDRYSHSFYNLRDQFSEKDKNTMREIYEYVSGEIPEEEYRYEYCYKMRVHNEKISNPTPKNCTSSTHKKTLIKTQLHTDNGSKPIYSQIISFDLTSSSSCSYTWNILYVGRYGGGGQAQFRTTSDFSQKDERIEIELWDFNTNRYMSPVFVKYVY